ncbi:MAG TPA: FAD-dependent monooxygenase [Actinomycetes bacterium]
MRASWDVIIVGARAAGAATAMLLARAGARVLVVDRARYGSDTLSTHALMRGGTLQLHRWGLLGRVLAAGTPTVRRTVFHYGADRVPVSIKPALGVDALVAPRRTVLDAALADAASESGAVLRYATAFDGLTRDRDGRVTGVVLRDRAGSAHVERSDLVVGADGRASSVAAAVEAPTLVAGRSAAAYVYGYFADLPVEGYEWFYGPGVAAGAIPTNGGLTCLFGAAPPARVAAEVSAAGPAGALRSLAAANSPELLDRIRGSRPAESVRYVRARPGYVRRAHGPGWALVGDAGSWKDPLSTHGLTDALRDAELLARAVISAPAPGTAQDGALAAYQSDRDRLSRDLVGVVERLATFAWDLDTVRGLVREMASAMTDEVSELAGLDLAAEPVARGYDPRGRTPLACTRR